MRVIGFLMVILAYLLLSSSFVVWGAYWVYQLATTDVNFFAALSISLFGLSVQLIIAFALYVFGYAATSSYKRTRKEQFLG